LTTCSVHKITRRLDTISALRCSSSPPRPHLFALGLLIAALARTASSLNVIGRLALIPLLFFAGTWLPRAGKPDPGGPDSILVGAGSDRVRRVQLQVDRSGGQTRIQVEPAGLSWLRLINTVGIGRKVRRALVTAPGLGSAPNPN
jgi:hypothetical protein